MTKFAAAFILCLSLSGCFWDDVVIPPTPISDAGGDPGAVSFEHDVVVGWKFPEINTLNSLQVIYPSKVNIIEAIGSKEFDIQIQLFIEKDHNDEYAQEYQQQIQSLSKLDEGDAVLYVPAPLHPCQETFDAHGNVTALQGICVESMTIVVPDTHPIPISIQAAGDFSISNVNLPSLQITLADSAQAWITQFVGDLKVTGGGPNSTLAVNGASTLDLELNAIKQANLQKITGKVHISLSQPDPNNAGAVTLDGKAITSFPFDRL